MGHWPHCECTMGFFKIGEKWWKSNSVLSVLRVGENWLVQRGFFPSCSATLQHSKDRARSPSMSERRTTKMSKFIITFIKPELKWAASGQFTLESDTMISKFEAIILSSFIDNCKFWILRSSPGFCLVFTILLSFWNFTQL